MRIRARARFAYLLTQELVRLAAVWSVLTAGAVLILVAAVIQLVLSYT
jgi:hypothetical protein